MPYKTIQQNFANGELNPKMQGRTDVDMYYKSAQKMRDVVTTPYGGFVRRPGSVNLYRGADGLQKLDTLTATTQLTEEAEHPVSNVLDGDKETFFKGQGNVEANTILFRVTDNPPSGTAEKTYYAYMGGKTYFAWLNTSGTGLEVKYLYTTERHPKPDTLFYYYYNDQFTQTNDYKFQSYNQGASALSITVYTGLGQYIAQYVYSEDGNKKEGDIAVYIENASPEIGTPIYSDTNGTVVDLVKEVETDKIIGTYSEYPRWAEKDVILEVSKEGDYKSARKLNIYGLKSNEEKEIKIYAFGKSGTKEIGTIVIGPQKKDFFINFELDGFVYLSLVSEKGGEESIECGEIEVYYEAEKSIMRLLPFVFNNSESYVIAITNQTIRIFSEDELVEQLFAPYFTYDIIKTLRYAQTADTAIFVHPNLRPVKLVRKQREGTWALETLELDSIPYHNFDSVEQTVGKGTLTPSNVDGTVKITLSEKISENIVGQYIEGNGGRVKITAQNDTTLKGYTIIGFYTADKIEANNWTYTTNYEPVWSDKRGWPSSVTFHQGRLWFGGSKERPQTVWGSKVGLFYKFDPTGGYDNDAIEFTLDTDSLNKITDIYSAKGLYIFTLGGEFVCQTSYGEPITPKNVSALKQSSNGSWENTQPVELEGSVIFVERKGQALMNFAYLTEEDYATSNASLVNSHLINQPEDLDVERNNLTQQTNYVYIVNKDGTMCVVNLLAAQGISGGFTLWQTEGKIKSVCVLPDATYIAVERNEQTGKPVYIEKLDWNNLTDNAKVVTLNEATQFTVPHLAGNTVDVLCDGKFVGQYQADEEGLVVFNKPLTGNVEIGLPFRSHVQSNFLEVPQMGTGVGKMKRLASMVVRVLDTPEVTINGETQKCKGEGIEDVHFYGIGDWDEKPTWEFTERTPHKFNIMAAQMDLNYQLSTDSY